MNLLLITYFEWTEELKMIAHFDHFEYRIGKQYFSR